MFDELNPEQRNAVTRNDGPVLIVAGPGTGKTKTLTARIAWLLQTRHVPPRDIAALTFTNKAAREMRARLPTLLGTSAKLPKICYDQRMRLLNQGAQTLQAKLQHYLKTDEKYAAVYAYTRQRFDAATNLVAHNWEHAYRDTLNAIVIGEAEGADMSIVLPAATMHDIGFLYGATGKTHGAVGADKLAEYLRAGGIAYPVETVAKIADCIRTHKGSMHQEKPESLEAKVVADADMLEKFGPFGVYSGLRTYAEFGYPIETILEREKQVFSLTLETPTGQRLAEPGRQFVADFYKELREANEPYST